MVILILKISLKTPKITSNSPNNLSKIINQLVRHRIKLLLRKIYYNSTQSKL